MRDVTKENFGLLIAFIVPGFTAVWGMAYLSPAVRAWLGQIPAEVPTVGGFLYATIAAIAAGLTVSTVRWLVIDTIHHRTGIRQPPWDFSRLSTHLAAYDVLIAIHYRYYQFYGGMCVAMLFAYACRRAATGPTLPLFGWPELGLAVVEVVFFCGSRDTLRKYYFRVGSLVTAPTSPRSKSRRASRS